MKTLSQKAIFRLITVVSVVIILMLAGAWVAYRVYIVRDGSPTIRRIASWLPAAQVDAHTITYGNFLKTRDTLDTYLSSPAAQKNGFATAMTPKVERSALDQIIREDLVKDLAVKRGVTVSNADVLGSFNAMVDANSSTVPDVSKYLDENYHWSEKDFQDNVIRPAIYEERVAATFSSSTKAQYAMLQSYLADQMKQPNVKIYLKFNK